MKAGSLARDLADLLLPRGCLACDERIPPEEGEGLVCQRCRIGLRSPTPPFCPRCHVPLGTGYPDGEECLECQRWPPFLVSARSAVILDQTASALVHALKYEGWRELADFMAARMEIHLPQTRPSPLLVPVPTTPWRRWVRGYNQAALLAGALSNRTSVPMADPLRRPGGRTQVRLGPRDRQRNVEGAFQLPVDARSLIRGREVILVDDVLTTGATALAAASTLVSEGVDSVRLLTFSRSLPFSEIDR